jgi:hypothetical protein
VTYRDDRETLRTRNEALEIEIAALRAQLAGLRPPARRIRWSRALRFGVPLVVFSGLLGSAAISLPAAPAPAPSAVAPPPPEVPSAPPPPPPSTPAPSAKRTRPSSTYRLGQGHDKEEIEYRAVVTHTDGAAPVRVGESCTLRIGSRPQGDAHRCAVNMDCGGRALRDGGYAKCTFDEHGLPHGRLDEERYLKARSTWVRLDGPALEFISNRSGDRFSLGLEIDVDSRRVR